MSQSAPEDALASPPINAERLLQLITDEYESLPRQLKHFDVRTDVRLSNDLANQHTVVEIVALDRPGLLAHIGRIFMEHKVNLQNARIATLGERAEDIFFLTDSEQQPISDPELCERLCDALRTQLDAR